MKKVKLDPSKLTYDGKGLSLVIDNEAEFEKHPQRVREDFNKNLPNGFKMSKNLNKQK